MLSFGAVCVCVSECVREREGCLLVYDTLSLRPPAVSPKGREKSAAVYIFVCLFLSLCVSACVCLVHLTAKSRHRQAAFSTERERGVKQIKHKPTNHRRRLISAVLKGEPGMSDDSPL